MGNYFGRHGLVTSSVGRPHGPGIPISMSLPLRIAAATAASGEPVQ